jgi:hypothetical protein
MGTTRGSRIDDMMESWSKRICAVTSTGSDAHRDLQEGDAPRRDLRTFDQPGPGGPEVEVGLTGQLGTHLCPVA